MSSHDGYSSDEEEIDVPKKSTVYLGFVDTEIDEEQPTTEDTFIGGQPVWLADSRPADDLLICQNCQSPMALVLQAFAPLEGALYDRVIYVLSCQKSTCNRTQGSVRAIRGVCKDPKKIAEQEMEIQAELKSQLESKLQIDNSKNFHFDDKKDEEKASNPFGASTANPFDTAASANPFASSTTASNPFGANPFEQMKSVDKPSFSSVAAKAAPVKPQAKKKSSNTKKLPEYPGYFTYVDQEKFNKKPQSKKIPDNVHIADGALDLDETGSSTKERDLNPEAQSVSTGLQDSVFQHFSEIVEYNPRQVLRYDIGGKPLLFSGKDDTAKKVVKSLVPRPGYNPSSSRHFELQVMPKTIMDFEKDNVEIVGGIEWGTIIVYTDAEDYVPDLDEKHVGYVEEWVGVQWEEPITRK